MELPITSILEWQAMTVLFSKIGATSVWAPLHCRLGIIARSARTGRLPSAPVSYTHLVCNLGLEHVPGALEEQEGVVIGLRAGVEVERIAGTLGVVNQVPVSYTHLDVYKRQLQ